MKSSKLTKPGTETTKMTRRFLSVLLALTGLLAASTAAAQEIQLTGPLAGAPPVRKMRLYREGRFEIAPTVSFSLLDEYRRTILVGGRLQYNIKEWISLGVWGGFGVASLATDLTDQIDQVAARNSRTAVNVNHTFNASTGAFGHASFDEQTARIKWVGAPQIQITPFRGKLAIFQKIFVDTDAFLHAGVAFVGLQERGDCGAAGQTACNDPKSFALADRTAIAPTFGIGLNFYLNDLISLGVDYRAMPFSWNRAGFDSRGSGNNAKFPDNKVDSQDQTFKFNQMVTIAVGFSLPTHPRLSE